MRLGQSNVLAKRRVGLSRGEVEISAPALGVKAVSDGNRLHERRFPCAVLTHQKRDLGVEFEGCQVAHGRQVEGELIGLGDAVTDQFQV